MAKNNKNQKFNIESYSEDLLKEKGFSPEKSGQDVFEQMKKDLVERIGDWLNMALLQKVPEDELDAFEKFMDTAPDGDQIIDYCKKFIDNMDEYLANSLNQFGLTYLNE